MYILTSSEMRELDRRTIEDIGIPPRVLMERAGVSVVLSMEREFENLENKTFIVMVGGGNNGGDGLVVARTLLDYTPDVTAILMKKDLKGEALENLISYENLGGEYLILNRDISEEELEYIAMSVDVIVDAILGTGIRGAVREDIARVIEIVNSSPAKKVCVDVPSGVDSDTGKIMGTAVKCDLTVTFAYPKIGQVLYPGREYCGKLKVASIGIPKILSEVAKLNRAIITEELARSLVPERPKDSNKGTFGRVAIIGGSVLYSGAPILSALGSIKSGAGLTYLLVPEENRLAAVSNYPEIISIPLDSCGGYLCGKSYISARSWIEKADVVALGPGMALNDDTVDFTREILRVEKPLVLDADGLNALSVIGADVLNSRKSPSVLTPHPGEFSRLVGKGVNDAKYNYILAEKFAKEHEIVLVLKGATTIVTDGNHTLFNLTGNTGLAKGGTGDVLTGIIAALMAQGLKPFEAATLGVYVHGMAAQIDSVDEFGLIPSEVARTIPEVFRKLSGR